VSEAQKKLSWVIVHRSVGERRPRRERPILRGLIFVWHHDGDCGLRVVDVERAASGDQFDKAGALVVVADIKRNWQPVRAALAILPGLHFQDCNAQHPKDVPESAGFVLVRAALAIR